MDHEGSAIQGDHEQSVTLGKSRSQAQGRVTGKDREIVTQERSMRGVLEGRLGTQRTHDGWKSEQTSVLGSGERGGLVPGNPGEESVQGSAIWSPVVHM